MHPKLNKTIIVLHIMAVIYFLIVLAVIVFLISFSLIVDEMEPEIPLTFLKITALFTVLLSIASGVFIEIVIKNLKNNQFWAWVAAVIICGLYIPSLFIILGIIGLKGLLDKEVRKEFIIKS